MTEIEKMQRYIDRTKMNRRTAYDMSGSEICALYDTASKIDAICFAFKYGMAKGYRAASRA